MFYYQLYFTGIIHISKQLLYILLEEIVREGLQITGQVLPAVTNDFLFQHLLDSWAHRSVSSLFSRRFIRLMDYNNSFSIIFLLFIFLLFLWIGAQFPLEKFLSYGRILIFYYYSVCVCVLLSRPSYRILTASCLLCLAVTFSLFLSVLQFLAYLSLYIELYSGRELSLSLPCSFTFLFILRIPILDNILS